MGSDAFRPERFVLGTGPMDIKEFRGLAEAAATLGFTHIEVGALVEKSVYQREEDLDDLYTEYCAVFPTMFKFHVPAELASAVPADYAKRNLEALAERAGIAAGLGLGGAFLGLEPAWLPERIYKEHPAWRGPRCDATMRSLHPYWAPCIDNEEVLELYRQAGVALADAAPNLDTFCFLACDSGSGVCWDKGLYPGRNGPTWCRDRPMKERLDGFTASITEGVRKHDGKPAVFIFHVGIWRWRGPLPAERMLSASIPGGLATAGSHQILPLANLANPFALLRTLEQCAEARSSTVVLFADSGLVRDRGVHGEVVRRFKSGPTGAVVERAAMLHEIASARVGEDAAPHVVEAWDMVDRALETYRQFFHGTDFRYRTVSQRWLTRPLVPFPLELEPAEKDYYRPFQFQTRGDVEAADLMNLQGTRLVDVPQEANWASTAFRVMLESLAAAVAHGDRAADACHTEEGQSFIRHAIRQWKALACLTRNQDHVYQFQAILDRAPADPPDQISATGSPDYQQMMSIMRAELDNALELIDLVAEDETLLLVAKDKTHEDTFWFNPDLVGQLRLKIDIMMKHWRDPQRLFARPPEQGSPASAADKGAG